MSEIASLPLDPEVVALLVPPIAVTSPGNVQVYVTEGSSGFVHTQNTPAATWIINHPLGRMPNIAVYIAGELVDTDVVASTTVVTITFPLPAAGVAVIT